MTAYWRLGFINASFSVARPVRFGLWKASRRDDFLSCKYSTEGGGKGEVYLRDRPSPITACNYSRINEFPTPSLQDRVGHTSACLDLHPGRDIVTKREILTFAASLWRHLCKTDRKNGIQLCLCCRSHESEHSASSAVSCSVKLLMPHSYDETATSSAASSSLATIRYATNSHQFRRAEPNSPRKNSSLLSRIPSSALHCILVAMAFASENIS